MTPKSNILLCTDLDRTLLPNGPQAVSEKAMAIFKQLIDQPEVKLAYVSGRDRSLLLSAIEEYDIPIPDYAIADVGTTIYEINDGWQKWYHWHDKISEDWGTHTQLSLAELMQDISELSLQEESKQGKYKLSYYADVNTDTVTLFHEINTRFHNRNIHASLVWSIDETTQTGLLDVLPSSANKLHAIRYLMQSLSYSDEQALFSGDSGNDLEVLSSEIQSVLVANATEEIKQQVIEQSQKNKTQNYIYIAQGDFFNMNGNYAAGILEGVRHFFPQYEDFFCSRN
ncbi:MAG: HAD-IIB family hydrolase [Gammaproteobacteria bacterium]|nr:HAD-IIB family hydrolase [Gammaproteobacteria bacterium]